MTKNIKLILTLILLITLVAALYYFKKGKGQISNIVLSDFAIEDTSIVDRIVITDFTGKKVDLKKRKNHSRWLLNDSLIAKKYATDLLLKTFKNIYVKGPVQNAAAEQIISKIAGTRIAVQIYSQNEILKTYYVGPCTPAQKGTYMVLEDKNGVKSSTPIITSVKSFTGCLRQRFFTSNDDWVFTGIYNYPNLEINKVLVTNHIEPEKSFKITYEGGNKIKLFSEKGNEIEQFDTLWVKDYLLFYKKVHFESLNSRLLPEQEDSLKNTNPIYTIKVFDNAGDNRTLEVYLKKAPQNHPEWESDLERMYGVMDKQEVGIIQTYVFNPILRSLSDFTN